MNRRIVSLLLWATSGLLLAIACALPIGLWAAQPVFTVDLPELEPIPVSPVASAHETDSKPPALAELSSIWERRVHPPEAPAPSAALAASKPRPAPSPPTHLRVKLLATAVESGIERGASRAVLLDADQQVVVMRVGDITGGVRVLRIEADRVVLEHRGKEVTLTLPGADPQRTGPANARKNSP